MTEGSPAFERAADDLERLSHLSRIEARGTLRLALREAGLAPRGVNFRSMLVVFEKAMPTMLGRRGVRGADEICRVIAAGLWGPAGLEGSGGDTPEKVFSRMASPARRSITPPPSAAYEAPPSIAPPAPSTGRLSVAPGPGSRR